MIRWTAAPATTRCKAAHGADTVYGGAGSDMIYADATMTMTIIDGLLRMPISNDDLPDFLLHVDDTDTDENVNESSQWSVKISVSMTVS